MNFKLAYFNLNTTPRLVSFHKNSVDFNLHLHQQNLRLYLRLATCLPLALPEAMRIQSTLKSDTNLSRENNIQISTPNNYLISEVIVNGR